KAIALVKMKLDKNVRPLAVDSTVLVRPRSALGLKYLQITPGRSRKNLQPGDTIPLSKQPAPLEYEDLFSTFNKATRDNSRTALKTGTPVLKRTPIMNNATKDVFRALDYLSQQPQTLLALKDLRTTLVVARPLLEYVAPYESVCDNATAFFTGLSTHLSMGVQ